MQPVTPRYYFYDAPIPTLNGTFSNITSLVSPIASTDFEANFGPVLGTSLNDTQLALLRAQVATAHAKGIMLRYWDQPGWPISTRNGIWRQLKSEGVDLINVDDLEGGAGFSDESNYWWRDFEAGEIGEIVLIFIHKIIDLKYNSRYDHCAFRARPRILRFKFSINESAWLGTTTNSTYAIMPTMLVLGPRPNARRGVSPASFFTGELSCETPHKTHSLRVNYSRSATPPLQRLDHETQ